MISKLVATNYSVMYRVTSQLLMAPSRVPPILRLEPLSTSSALSSEEASQPFYKRFETLLKDVATCERCPSKRCIYCRLFGGKKKAEAEESEPDEFAHLEKLEQEYQEEMRLKVG